MASTNDSDGKPLAAVSISREFVGAAAANALQFAA